jgi:hypothetical protein
VIGTGDTGDTSTPIMEDKKFFILLAKKRKKDRPFSERQHCAWIFLWCLIIFYLVGRPICGLYVHGHSSNFLVEKRQMKILQYTRAN